MTANDVIASGKQSFAPRARLVSVLGEQLIRDARVGLIELVKNAYDADASQVTVELLGLRKPETTEIVISDDGEGMDRETVLGKWLEPATGNKAIAKKDQIRSPIFGRLPLGEKGVGRFAAHRLGHKLELITRKKDTPEIVLKVDCDKFDDTTLYLAQVDVEWEERKPVVFTKKKTGTCLIMRQAREQWSESDVRSVSEGFRRLMSPFKTVADFSIRFVCPDFPKYEDLDPGDLLNRAHAKFEGLVDENGIMQGDYHFKLSGFPERKETFPEVDLRKTLGKTTKWEPVTRKPACGGFFFNFYVWDRTSAILNLTGTRKDELDQRMGVSVFRDRLRILPYGDPDDDWLEMDEERYMRTSEAIGRKSVVASIEITQTGNPWLRDKTNREGLIENQAFNDFKSLVKATVRVLENTWATDRRVIHGAGESKERIVAKPALEKLKTQLDGLRQTTGLTRSTVEKFSVALEKGNLDSPAAVELSNALSQLQRAIPHVETAAQYSTETLEQVATDLEDERDLLLGLAGLGLAAERFTHEFARLTREASDIIKRIRSRSDGLGSAVRADLDALSATIDALRNDIRRL